MKSSDGTVTEVLCFLCQSLDIGTPIVCGSPMKNLFEPSTPMETLSSLLLQLALAIAMFLLLRGFCPCDLLDDRKHR